MTNKDKAVLLNVLAGHLKQDLQPEKRLPEQIDVLLERVRRAEAERDASEARSEARNQKPGCSTDEG